MVLNLGLGQTGALVAVGVVDFLWMERDHGERVDFLGRGEK